MKILVVKPMEAPYTTEIDNTLKDMQKMVGGLIEEIPQDDDSVALICNEEGKLIGLPANRVLRDDNGRVFDIIAGTFFICGVDEEDFTDIPEDMIEKYYQMFRKPEIIL